jgi:protein SCO1
VKQRAARGRRAGLLAAAVAGTLLLALAPEAAEFRTSDVTGQGYGDAMPALIGQDGHTRTREDFKGRVTVLFFGFTHCPDLCPTALANLADAIDRLGEDRDRVAVAFVTVDPDRDMPEALRDYLHVFGPSFFGLTGDHEAIRATAKAFHVFFQKVPLADGGYTMDHSATAYIFDPQARVRLMFTTSRAADDVATDILALLHEAQ